MSTVAHAGRCFTCVGYLGWQGDEGHELLDGVACLKSPASGLAHQKVAGEVYRQLANALGLAGTAAPSSPPVGVRLPAGEKDNDAVGHSGAARRARGVRPGETGIVAEGEGFEPPDPCGSTVFKTAAFDHSATPPEACVSPGNVMNWRQETGNSTGPISLIPDI